MDWLTPDLFRFGASTLLNDVLMQIRKQKTGAYQSLDYFIARPMEAGEFLQWAALRKQATTG